MRIRRGVVRARAGVRCDPRLADDADRAAQGFAYAWQQETIAEDTRKIAALGRELYERVGLFASHYAKLGRALDTAVGAYNQASGSLERRLLVTARKFEQHGIGGEEELEPKPIDKTTTRSRPPS